MTSHTSLQLVRLRVVAALVLSFVLAACGGQPGPIGPDDPGGVLSVEGKVVLPGGANLDLATLTVTTPLGTYPVSATGEFSASVFAGAVTELDVETQAGNLLSSA